MIPRLHLVTDDRVLAQSAFCDQARSAIAAAVGAGTGTQSVAMHLRGPGTSARRLSLLVEELLPWCREHHVPMLANDRVDLALALGMDGAHLGGRSLPVGQARAVLGDGALLGRSVHGGTEAREMKAERGGRRGVDFVVAGTVFSTPSHPERAGKGATLIREVAGAVPEVPVIGIGGITKERVPSVLNAGAYGVAVVRAVWEAEDPAAEVRGLLRCLHEGGEEDRRG